jgi:HlyD family secretion protein
VTRKTIRLGQIAAMASGPLFTLIRDGAIELEADASETTLARIKVGQIVKVAPPGGVVVDGRVRLVAPEVNRATRLGRVRVALDGASGLAIGTFARGTVEIAAAQGVTVPLSAVQFEPNRATVQVVDGSRIETRTVQLGLRADGFVQIVSGLAVGTQVVSRAGTFVRDGDKVTPVEMAAGARS